MDLSTVQTRLLLVTKWARKYGLDPAIVAAVCEQESDWCTWAVRFEPAFLRNYVRPVIPDKPTTQEITRATSFGLMQVMGLVAIEHGFGGRFLTELCDPDVGVDYGCRKLQRCFETHTDPETSLLSYNGGGNPDYGNQVIARVGHYATS